MHTPTLRHSREWLSRNASVAIATFVLMCLGLPAIAQDANPDASKPYLDIYGHAMVDTGYDFKQIDPNWFDVVRPTKLPSFQNEFGKEGNSYAGVRQSRFGAK